MQSSTDIPNESSYHTDGKNVYIELDEQEVGYDKNLTFEANEDFTELKLISDGSNSIWKLNIEGVDPWDL